MTDPRIEELLERYPEGLDEPELDELRAAAERDPGIGEQMDALHHADALLRGCPEPAALSDKAAQRLQRLVERAKEGVPASDRVRGWSTGGSTPAGRQDEQVRGWSTGGSTPAGRKDGSTEASSKETTQAAVVDIAGARRRRRFLLAHPAATALAALLLVAVGFALRDQLRPSSPWGFKGDDDVASPDRVQGQLWVMGESRLSDGDSREVSSPITFRAVMEEPAALVLVETQDGRSFVLFPDPGQAWTVGAGTHLLQPEGMAATYTPARPGPATYTLLASRPDAPIPVPPDREVGSPIDLAREQDGATVIGTLSIVWESR